MAEQSKKTKKRFTNEQIAQAFKSMKGRPLPTDTDPFRVYKPINFAENSESSESKQK